MWIEWSVSSLSWVKILHIHIFIVISILQKNGNLTFLFRGLRIKKGFTRKSSNTVTALNWDDTVLAIKLQPSYWFNYHTFIQNKLDAFFFLVSPLTELSKHCWWWRIAWARWFSSHIFAVTARTSWWTPRSCKCWQARCSSTISSYF